MSFAVVIEGMTIAAFAILLAGGKQRREAGWGALAILTALAATVQAIGMALIVSRKQAFRHPFTDTRRHTFMRMMSGSLQAGSSTKVGRCAQSPGYSRVCVLWRSPSQHLYCRLKAVMS